MSAQPPTETGPPVRAFEALWGLEGSLAERLWSIRDRGYDGVEAGLPEILAAIGVIESREVADFRPLLADTGLDYLPMVFTYGDDPGGHLRSFQVQVSAAMSYEPSIVCAHTGTDALTLVDAIELLEAAFQLELDTGIRIGHETHRGRILHSPFVWRDVHAALPDLSTVADLSHWVVVCERLPDDLTPLIRTCAERAVHIHGRVGHPQGPQVADPRMREAADTLAWHERWWSEILRLRMGAGDQLTFDPEYGPPPYLPVTPGSANPAIELSEIRLWAVERARMLAARLSSGAT